MFDKSVIDIVDELLADWKGNERLQYAAFIDRYRGDSVETVQAGTITATRQRINHGQWTTTGHAFTLNVNYTPQRPSNKE